MWMWCRSFVLFNKMEQRRHWLLFLSFLLSCVIMPTSNCAWVWRRGRASPLGALHFKPMPHNRALGRWADSAPWPHAQGQGVAQHVVAERRCPELESKQILVAVPDCGCPGTGTLVASTAFDSLIQKWGSSCFLVYRVLPRFNNI